MTPLEALAIFLLSAGASVVQALTGLGFGLMIVPPLVMVVGPKDAVVLSNVLGTLLSGTLFALQRGHVEWRLALALLAASLVGMPAGLLILEWIDAGALQVVIALTVMVFTVLLARGLRIHAAGLAGDAIAGILSGVLRMSTSMSGPPVVIYLQGRGLPSATFRATLSAFFVAGGLISAAMFLAAGKLDAEAGRQVAVGAPALGLGVASGSLLYRHVDEGRFRRLVPGVLFTSSALAIAAVAFR